MTPLSACIIESQIMAEENEKWEAYRMYVVSEVRTLRDDVSDLSDKFQSMERRVDQIAWKVGLIISAVLFILIEGPRIYEFISRVTH